MANKRISEYFKGLLSISYFQNTGRRTGENFALIICFGIFLSSNPAKAQPNCNVYLFQGDTLKYDVCSKVIQAGKKYYQFRKEYHQILDSAIVDFPEFAYVYREKAAPYVKTGNFIEWKRLIDKAVLYDRSGYLPIRASLRYKFFADYEGAIKDIDSLSSEFTHNIGYSGNGMYHLNIVKGLCYKALGNHEKAIRIIETQIKKQADFIGAYDYLHLGVLYLKVGDFEKALEAFKNQERENDIAENRFYESLVYKNTGQKIENKNALSKAEEYFKGNRKMWDGYNILFDQIFLDDIKIEQSGLNKEN